VDGLRLLELTGQPNGTGGGITETSFQLPLVPRSAAQPPHPVLRRSAGTKVGLVLLFTNRGLHPDTAFAGLDVNEFYQLEPSTFGLPRPTGRLTAAQLVALAEALPATVAAIKR